VLLLPHSTLNIRNIYFYLNYRCCWIIRELKLMRWQCHGMQRRSKRVWKRLCLASCSAHLSCPIFGPLQCPRQGAALCLTERWTLSTQQHPNLDQGLRSFDILRYSTIQCDIRPHCNVPLYIFCIQLNWIESLSGVLLLHHDRYGLQALLPVEHTTFALALFSIASFLVPTHNFLLQSFFCYVPRFAFLFYFI
jgi:hypothetical protein